MISESGTDIVFLIDSSGSIGQSNFDHMVSSVISFINQLDLDDGSETNDDGLYQRARVAIAIFNDMVETKKHLNDYFPLPPLTYLGGRTNITRALE